LTSYTLLMPCLNEAETLSKCIKKAHQGTKLAGLKDYEILIVDNGSTDGSQALAIAEGARVVSMEKRGYGAALIKGINEARGEYVVMGDADDSYDWSDLKPYVTKLSDGADLVIGTRIKGNIAPNAMPFLHRWIGNPILTGLGNILFRTKLSDYHGGMRGFKRNVIQNLNLRTSGMEFATEMIAKAAIHGLNISEIPINYHVDGRSRKPHLNTWGDGWRHLTFMFLVSPNWILLFPGLIILFFGMLGTVLTLPAPLVIGKVTFDVQTLLVSSMAIILGMQLITFWLIAKLYTSVTNLMPASSIVQLLSRGKLLSYWLLAGFILSVLGLLPLSISFINWLNVDLGALNYQTSLRLVIPSLVLLAIGLHIFFAAFVMALINLEHD